MTLGRVNRDLMGGLGIDGDGNMRDKMEVKRNGKY